MFPSSSKEQGKVFAKQRSWRFSEVKEQRRFAFLPKQRRRRSQRFADWRYHCAAVFCWRGKGRLDLRFHREEAVKTDLIFQPAACFGSSSFPAAVSAADLRSACSSSNIPVSACRQRFLRQQQSTAAFRTVQQRFSNLQQRFSATCSINF